MPAEKGLWFSTNDIHNLGLPPHSIVEFRIIPQARLGDWVGDESNGGPKIELEGRVETTQQEGSGCSSVANSTPEELAPSLFSRPSENQQ